KESAICQAAVHDRIEPPRLLRVPLESVAAIVLIFEGDEMMHLSRNRPGAAVLEHEPFEDRDARLQVLRPELAGLLAEIDENRARLGYDEQRNMRALRVADS